MFRSILIGSLGLALTFSSAAKADVIKIEGGGAATAAVFYPLKESYEEDSGNTLLIKMSTPVEGLIALEKGLVDIATGAVPLADIIRGAAREGVKIDPATLKTRVVAQNSTLVFIHKPSTVNSLSKEQLKKIFTGKITNWRELGDKDLPIDVIWGSRTPGQNALFTENILDGEPVTARATPATDYENIRELVIKRPGAIGIAPKGLKMGAIKVPTTPKLPSPIIVITKGTPPERVQKVIDFIALSLFERGS
ncbi:MAG: substrate-binding domain-containing protein [Desulfobulbaceae bacterium]|nr:substrate-binding domain-containing protein [Desulfobulbaceae bacterium]